MSKKTIRNIIATSFGYLSMNGDLSTLTKSELIDVARAIGAKISGNMNEIRHNIRITADELNNGVYFMSDVRDFIIKRVNTDFTADDLVYYINFNGDCDLISESEYEAMNLNQRLSDYIANNKLYVNIARGTIYSISCNDKISEGTDACMRIVNNGFREEIVKDLEMAIAESLHIACMNGQVSVYNNKLSFPRGLAYKAILSELGLYRQRQSQTKCDSYVDEDIDGIPFLSQISSIDNILDNQNVIDFLRFMTEKTGTEKGLQCMDYIRNRIAGYDRKGCARLMNVSERTIDRIHILIKVLWAEYDTPLKNEADSKSYGVRCGYENDCGHVAISSVIGLPSFDGTPLVNDIPYHESVSDMINRAKRTMSENHRKAVSLENEDGYHVYTNTSKTVTYYFRDGKLVKRLSNVK